MLLCYSSFHSHYQFIELWNGLDIFFNDIIHTEFSFIFSSPFPANESETQCFWIRVILFISSICGFVLRLSGFHFELKCMGGYLGIYQCLKVLCILFQKRHKKVSRKSLQKFNFSTPLQEMINKSGFKHLFCEAWPHYFVFQFPMF